MKALLFIPKLDRGGPDRVFAELAAGLPRHGFEVSVLVHAPGGHYWDKLPADVSREALPARDARAYPVRAFARYVEEQRPDVVLCTLRSVLAAAAAVLLQMRTPLVIRPANHLTRNSLELLRQSPAKHALSWLAGIASLHLARHVVCQSKDLYQDFRRYGVPESRLSIIGNPIDLPADDLVRGWRRMRAAGRPSLVAAGRLMPQKGFDLLIDAVALLKDRLPGLSLRIFGEGPDRAALDQRILRHGLAGRVILENFSAELVRELASADFLVSSSRYEGFPNVVLEALSVGTAVIATDCPGGTSELVRPGVTGWLCAPESADALADTILNSCSMPKLAPQALRQFVEDHYSSDKVAGAYARMLRCAAKQN